MKPPDRMSEDELLLVGQVVLAQEAIVKSKEWEAQARGDRDEGVNGLRMLGWTIPDCAQLTGLAPSLIHRVGRSAGLTARRGAEKS